MNGWMLSYKENGSCLPLSHSLLILAIAKQSVAHLNKFKQKMNGLSKTFNLFPKLILALSC